MSEAQLGGWHSVKSRLQMLRNVGFLVFMTFLDVRDLWYKLTWVGPYDAYAFDAGSRGTLLPEPLPVLKTLPARFVNIEHEMMSGWPSYTSRCESLTPFCSPGSTFFLNAMMRNCDVGVHNETKAIARLVMTSNVRSDSLAWGACQLLYGHRRPAICQQNIVANFLDRYRFQATPVLRDWMADPDSPAEAEVLRFLEVISMSYPRYRVICTGGFDYQLPGEYHPTIFGCASASVYRAEFIGVYATGIRELMYNKAWLTAIDIVTMVDVSYRFRQNTVNKYLMEEETIDGAVALSITESTVNNFVASGMLYVLMIVIDCILLLSSMYTGVELVTKWILPLLHKRDELDFEKEMKAHAGSNAHLLTNLKADAKAAADAAAEDKAIFSQEEYTSFLSTSLYRHPLVVVLTVITQFISWGIIIPNSVVWTWSLSNYSKVMAFASSLRIWTLILVGVNFVWDIAVLISEKHAYALARAIYITSFEVMGIGAIVAFFFKDEVMAISETKFGIEYQRVNDFISFPTYIAHGNTFNEDLDYSQNSEGSLLYEMYMPLIRIVCYSVLGVYIWVVVKLALFQILDTPPMLRLVHSLRRVARLENKQYHPEELSSDPETRRNQMRNSAHAIDPIQTQYFRLPVEKIIGIPMRARSLVRPTLSMQKEVNGETVLRPAIHLDFGIFIRERKITARSGFEWTVRAVAPLPPSLSAKSTRNLAVAMQTPPARLVEEEGDAEQKKAREVSEREEYLQMKRMSRGGKGSIVYATNEE